MTKEATTMDADEFDAAMRRTGNAVSGADGELWPDIFGVPVYLDADDRTIYRIDAEGRRVDVGQIVETTPTGLVVEMVPTLTSVAGTVVQK